jgi:hypothetical protein
VAQRTALRFGQRAAPAPQLAAQAARIGAHGAHSDIGGAGGCERSHSSQQTGTMLPPLAALERGGGAAQRGGAGAAQRGARSAHAAHRVSRAGMIMLCCARMLPFLPRMPHSRPLRAWRRQLLTPFCGDAAPSLQRSFAAEQRYAWRSPLRRHRSCRSAAHAAASTLPLPATDGQLLVQ